METENKTSLAPIKLEVVDRRRNSVESVELSAGVFGAEVKPHLMHEMVVYQQAKHRSGSAKTKRRGEVSGSNKKMWRQKGTGRARAGEKRNPVWRGGGIVFGPQPRDYSFKLSKKTKKAALRSAISAKREDQRLLLVNELKLERIKTQDLLAWLKDLGVGENVLIVIAAADPAVELSARNLPKVKALRAHGLNVRDILLYDWLVMTKDAALIIQESLS